MLSLGGCVLQTWNRGHCRTSTVPQGSSPATWLSSWVQSELSSQSDGPAPGLLLWEMEAGLDTEYSAQARFQSKRVRGVAMGDILSTSRVPWNGRDHAVPSCLPLVPFGECRRMA